MKASDNKVVSKKTNPLIPSCVGVCKETYSLEQQVIMKLVVAVTRARSQALCRLKMSTSAKDNERQAKLVCGLTKFPSTPFSSSKYRNTPEHSL
jgi:hypothetical protein